MLATYIGNRLIVSDIAHAIATGDQRMDSVDGYLYEVERRFRYPFPAFNNYGCKTEVVWGYLKKSEVNGKWLISKL